MRGTHPPAWPIWRRRGEARVFAVPVFRLIILLLLVAGVACFAIYAWTGQVRYRSLGIRIVKWALIAAFGFFAVLIVERVAMIL